MFTGQECCNLVETLLKDFAKSKEHPSSSERRLRGPGWECRGGSGNSGVDFRWSGQSDPSLHLSTGGVIHVSISTGTSGQ
jgi:hypothetical protein